MTIDNAGNTLGTARKLSLTSTTQTFTDFVGASDANDFYSFSLGSRSSIILNLGALSANADVQIIQDRNSNGVFDGTSEIITGAYSTGTVAESITTALDPGNYFIRVYPGTGANTNYSLGVSATPLDSAGNTLTTARQITVDSTTTSFTDWVGTTDTNDYYRFTVNQNSNFNVSVTGLSGNADLQLLDVNGAILIGSLNIGTSSEAISHQLSAGTYFVRVFSVAGANTNYNLGVSAMPVPPDFAGNTLATARQINILSTTATTTDWVGTPDTNDYYRFTLNQNSNFNVSITGLSSNADLQLLDASGAVIASSLNAGTNGEAINRQLGAGNYFIRVFPGTGGNTYYNFNASSTPIPPDFAGNSLSTARQITVGSTTTSFTDWVGTADTNDYYRFTLNQNSNLNLSVTGLSGNADIQIIQDINGNSQIDANEILGISNLTGNSSESIIVPLVSDNYFIRVYPNGSNVNTSYSMNVSAASLGNSTFTDSSPLSNTYYNTTVTRSYFNGGINSYISQHGNFIMYGSIADYYTNNQFANKDTNNGLFGVYSGLALPTSPIYRRDDGSFVMEFEGGTLISRNGVVTASYNQKASSFALVGQGAPNGTELQWKNDYSYWSKNVGTPTSAVRYVAGGWVQEFADSQGKVINIFTVKDGQQLTQGGPNRVQGAMLDIYRLTGGYERTSGGLGFATIAEEKSNFGIYKHYQSFDNGFIGVTTDNKIIIKNNQGQLINVIGYDGNAIHNTYRNTFSRVGGSLSLGSPISNVRPWGNGYTQEFAGGSEGKGAIMKSNNNDNSYWVGGEFWNQIQAMGGATGILSYPTSERYSTIGGASRQDFLGGAIIKTSKGMFTLFGGIGSHYLNSEGGERGRLGLPTSGEVGIGNGVVVQNFEKGRIVYGDRPTRTEMPAYNDFGNPDQIITSWSATFYHWNGKLDFSFAESYKIGTVNLGSNTRGDGQFGIAQNWGSGSPARNVPTDFFAMKAQTRVGLTAGRTYEVWVRADDGYRIFAHKLDGNHFDITPNAVGGTWQPGAYGDYVKHRFTAPESGTFDFHLSMYEGGGDSLIDVILKDVTAPQPSGYFRKLSSLSTADWNFESRDNLFFDNNTRNGESRASVKQIYSDLSNGIFNTYKTMTAGYFDTTDYSGDHYGIDMAGRPADRVRTIVGGTTTLVQNAPGNYFVGVRGDDGNLWIYGHLKNLSVRIGSRVEAGTALGEIFDGGFHNGFRMGPHLHLEVHRGHTYNRRNSVSPLEAYWRLRNR